MPSSYEAGRVMGIPIRLHISLFILLPFILLQVMRSGFGFFMGILAVAGLYASVALHELGHSAVALWKHCPVRQILLTPIGGIAQLERMPTRPMDEFLIAIAGPLVSFLLFGAGMVLMFGSAMAGLIRFSNLFLILGAINFMLGAFNLLPSFPMDGGRILRAFLSPKMGRLKATEIAMKTGRVIAVLMALTGIFLSGSLLLVAIGIFVWIAGGAEYRAVQIQETMGAAGFTPPWMAQPHPGQPRPTPPPSRRPPPAVDDSIYVSPPPYERKDR